MLCAANRESRVRNLECIASFGDMQSKRDRGRDDIGKNDSEFWITREAEVGG